jgi:hypothetical protein
VTVNCVAPAPIASDLTGASLDVNGGNFMA